jgi:hypothetical protein
MKIYWEKIFNCLVILAKKSLLGIHNTEPFFITFIMTIIVFFFINTTGFYSKHIETFLDNGQWLKVQNEKHISFEGKNPKNGKCWKLVKIPGRIIGYVNASEKMRIRFDFAIWSYK